MYSNACSANKTVWQITLFRNMMARIFFQEVHFYFLFLLKYIRITREKKLAYHSGNLLYCSSEMKGRNSALTKQLAICSGLYLSLVWTGILMTWKMDPFLLQCFWRILKGNIFLYSLLKQHGVSFHFVLFVSESILLIFSFFKNTGVDNLLFLLWIGGYHLHSLGQEPKTEEL